MNDCFLIQFPVLPPCQELGAYGLWFGRETEGPDRSRGTVPRVALPAGEMLPCHSFQPWPSRVLRGRLASGLTHGGQEANENTLVSSSCWVVWKHWLLSIKHAGEDSGRRREGRLARVWDLRTSRRQGGINTLPQGAGTPAPTGGTEGRSHPGVSTETACRAQTSTSACQKQSWVPFLWHLERN